MKIVLRVRVRQYCSHLKVFSNAARTDVCGLTRLGAVFRRDSYGGEDIPQCGFRCPLRLRS